jgi:hypothetical protein
MPLEFESISHGRIAFGFFNIETDMVLLNHYFFFARDLCHCVVQAAQKNEKTYEASWEVYQIENGADIGNLMGAIYGTDHRGFIGEVYKLFPFPREREGFKQKPEGFKTRPQIEELIQKYGRRITISFVIDQRDDKALIGEYVFSRTAFQELIKYVWVGGFPRWKDAIRPDYVMAMKGMIEQSKKRIFDGLILK